MKKAFKTIVVAWELLQMMLALWKMELPKWYGLLVWGLGLGS